MKKQLLTLTIPAIIGLNNFVNAQAPNWLWAQAASGVDYAESVTSDPSGNLIVAGSFNDSTCTFGSITLTNVDTDYSDDMFIVKYDQAGTVLWAKSAGGSHDDGALSVTADALGNLVATGYFSSTITFDSITLINSGGCDMFIVKFDPSGIVLWAKSAMGNWYDIARSVTSDSLGNLIVVGNFESLSLIFGAVTLNNNGGGDIFIVKYDQAGNVLWAKQSLGSLGAEANSVTTDVAGNLIVAGDFNSPTITFGSTTLTNAGLGYHDMFIVKYDPAGNIIWAKSAGGSSTDAAKSVTADASGSIIVTGFFFSPTIPFGSTTLNNPAPSCPDIFFVKYDSAGTVLWAKSAMGNYNDYPSSITADALGNIFVAGWFDSPTLTFDSTTLTNNIGGDKMFIVEYDQTGTLLWAISAGLGATRAITADHGGNIVAVGSIHDSLTFGSITLINTGNSNMFIAKLNNITGIVNSESDQEIFGYPNPNNGNFTLQTPDVIPYSIKIYNPLGEKIYEEEKIFSQKKAINISEQPDGIYIAELHSKTKVLRVKVVVQH